MKGRPSSMKRLVLAAGIIGVILLLLMRSERKASDVTQPTTAKSTPAGKPPTIVSPQNRNRIAEQDDPPATINRDNIIDSRLEAQLAAARQDQLVQCQTTKGGFFFKPRFDWAPRGAGRLMALVDAQFFSNMTFFRVPPMPSNPIAQFGLSPNATLRGLLNDPRGAFKAMVDDAPALAADDEPGGSGGGGMTLGGQEKGHFGFGGAGPNTRTFHMWLARDRFSKHSPHLGKNPWDMSIAEILPAGTVARAVVEYQQQQLQVNTAAGGAQEEQQHAFSDVGIDVVSRIFQVGDMAPWGQGPSTGKMLADSSFSDRRSFPGEYLRNGHAGVDWFRWCRRL